MRNQNGASLPGFPISRWLVSQLAFLIVLMIVAYIVTSLTSMITIGVGGLISIIPNTLFTWFIYRYRGAKNASRMIDSMYMGESLKFLITAAMFAGVFAVGGSSMAPEVFVGFMFATITGWVGSVRLQRS